MNPSTFEDEFEKGLTQIENRYPEYFKEIPINNQVFLKYDGRFSYGFIPESTLPNFIREEVGALFFRLAEADW